MQNSLISRKNEKAIEIKSYVNMCQTFIIIN